MISGFNRSISLPMNSRPKARERYHVRSVSLPSQSHPLISNLERQISAARTWAAGSEDSLACIETGLSQIELLYLVLNDFLNLPETRNALQLQTESTEHLLDNLLYLVDLNGSFLSAIAMLKQQLFEVQSAFRRCDSNLLASSLKSQRKTEKQLSKLASSLRTSTKLFNSGLASDVEIFSLLKEAICAASAISVTVFNRVIAVSTITSTAAASLASTRTTLFAKKGSKQEKEMKAFDKLKELEKCVEIVEGGSERVFRGLVNSRVSLLNIQSYLF